MELPESYQVWVRELTRELLIDGQSWKSGEFFDLLEKRTGRDVSIFFWSVLYPEKVVLIDGGDMTVRLVNPGEYDKSVEEMILEKLKANHLGYDQLIRQMLNALGDGRFEEIWGAYHRLLHAGRLKLVTITWVEAA